MIEFMDEDDLMADVDDVDVDSSPPEEVMEIIRSKTGWQDLDPTRIQIPALSLQHIHQYFIKNRLCKEHVTATKPFEKGYRIFSAQKVKSLSVHPVSSTSVYCIVRAAVLPTQRKDRTYETAVALYNTTSSVYCAYCTCVAGMSGSCNHVAAVMFALDDYNRDISTRGNKGLPSCTSVAARWGMPSHQRIPAIPMHVEEMRATKPAIGKTPPSPTPLLNCSSHAIPTQDRIHALITELEEGCYVNLMIQQLWSMSSSSQHED